MAEIFCVIWGIVGGGWCEVDFGEEGIHRGMEDRWAMEWEGKGEEKWRSEGVEVQ
jgi:hypothetical protein